MTESSLRLPSMSDLYQENGFRVHYFFVLVRELASNTRSETKPKFARAGVSQMLSCGVYSRQLKDF